MYLFAQPEVKLLRRNVFVLMFFLRVHSIQDVENVLKLANCSLTDLICHMVIHVVFCTELTYSYNCFGVIDNVLVN